MSETVIRVENLSKLYRLGVYGSGTLRDDLARWWARVRGKSDPTLNLGATNLLSQKDEDYIWALKDINFTVKKGEVLGIIGRNGAGKSTLLKILSQVTSPTGGRVKVKGRIASLLEVGTGMHPELTGKENIFLNGAILGMTKSEIRKKFDDIISFSGVEKYADTPVKRYSSGMRVRLGFAVAAFLEPEILIVDEVLAVGDAEFQKKAIGKMQEVSTGNNITVLFVSHNMSSISNLCSSTIIISDGAVDYIGKTQNAINKYLHNIYVETKLLLKHREDRKGSGDVIITDFRIIEMTSKIELNKIMAGQDVIFEISYESTNQIRMIDDINIGISIFDSKGNFVTVLNNKMAGFELINCEKTGKIFCEIKRIPLMSGIFFLNLILQINRKVSDSVENAITIEVEEGDFYGSGISNAYGRQGTYINQLWHI